MSARKEDNLPATRMLANSMRWHETSNYITLLLTVQH